MRDKTSSGSDTCQTYYVYYSVTEFPYYCGPRRSLHVNARRAAASLIATNHDIVDDNHSVCIYNGCVDTVTPATELYVQCDHDIATPMACNMQCAMVLFGQSPRSGTRAPGIADNETTCISPLGMMTEYQNRAQVMSDVPGAHARPWTR